MDRAAENLAKEWGMLRLTEEEATVVVARGKRITENDQKIAWSLAGRLMTSKPFNRRAFKATIERIFRPRNNLVIKELDTRTFVFQFFSEGDRKFVLDHEPWIFDNHLLAIREIRGEDKMDDLKFDKVRLWVKALNLPFGARDREMAVLIGNRIGRFVSFDAANDFGWDKALNIRVEIDINKPLRRGMKMAFEDFNEVWIQFKYCYLLNYYYACGIIGHVEKECHVFGEEERKEVGLQYGPWLRATPNKNVKRPTSAVHEREKKLFADLGFNEEGVCRRKLRFDEGIQGVNSNHSAESERLASNNSTAEGESVHEGSEKGLVEAIADLKGTGNVNASSQDRLVGSGYLPNLDTLVIGNKQVEGVSNNEQMLVVESSKSGDGKGVRKWSRRVKKPEGRGTDNSNSLKGHEEGPGSKRGRLEEDVVAAMDCDVDDRAKRQAYGSSKAAELDRDAGLFNPFSAEVGEHRPCREQ